MASGQGKSERVRGRDQGEPPGSDAHERKGRRALSWPCHGGVAVAAGGGLWGAWHGSRGSSARQWAVEELQRDAWVLARSRRWPGAAHGGGWRWTAAVQRGAEDLS